MLTPLYDRWIEFMARQHTALLSLMLAALGLVAVVWNAKPQRRRWLLWAGYFAFWWSLAVLFSIIPPDFPPFSAGVVIEEPPWYDETFTWAVTRLPLDRMMDAIRGDVHPPLWYLIEWVAVRVAGDSPAGLRAAALALGLVAMALTYWLARELGYRRRLAALVLLGLAITPGWLHYCQEARMYTLLTCGVLLSAIGLVTRRRWLTAAGWVVVLYSHNLGCIYVATSAVLSLWDEYQQRGDSVVPDQHLATCLPVTTLAWGAVAFVAWLPGLRLALAQVADVADGFWVQDYGLGGYLMPLYRLTFGMSTAPELSQHTGMVASAAGALAVWGAIRQQRWKMLALFLAPPVLLALISELWRPLYLNRVFVPLIPVFMLLFVAALDQIPRPQLKPILAVWVPVSLLAVMFMSRTIVGSLPEIVSETLEDAHKSGDVIWHGNLASYISTLYWLRPEDGYTHIVRPDAGDLSQALTIPTQRALGINRQSAAAAWEETGTDRLWVIWVENPMMFASETEAVKRALALGEARLVGHFGDREEDLAFVEVWEVVPWSGSISGRPY